MYIFRLALTARAQSIRLTFASRARSDDLGWVSRQSILFRCHADLRQNATKPRKYASANEYGVAILTKRNNLRQRHGAELK